MCRPCRACLHAAAAAQRFRAAGLGAAQPADWAARAAQSDGRCQRLGATNRLLARQLHRALPDASGTHQVGACGWRMASVGKQPACNLRSRNVFHFTASHSSLPKPNRQQHTDGLFAAGVPAGMAASTTPARASARQTTRQGPLPTSVATSALWSWMARWHLSRRWPFGPRGMPGMQPQRCALWVAGRQ